MRVAGFLGFGLDLLRLVRRALPSGMIDGVVSLKDDLGDGEEGVALLKQLFQNGGQRLRGVLGGVVKQDNGAGLNFGSYPLGDLRSGGIFSI